MKKKNKVRKPKARDGNIRLALKKEISLGTKTIKSKKIYSRKEKHTPKYGAELSTDN